MTHSSASAEARVEFLRRLAHNVRSQLAAITGYAELTHKVALRAAVPNLDQYTRRIIHQTLAVGQMIDQAVWVARIDEAQLKATMQPLALGVLVGEICQELGVSYEREIRWHDALSPQTVLGDVVYMRQVVAAVVDNALKFSPPETPVHIEARPAPAPGWAVLLVTDEGYGIAAEDYPILFTRFGRIYTPRTQGSGGNGLGLYVAKHLIECQHGQIQLQSQPERGTTVIITLPLSEAV